MIRRDWLKGLAAMIGGGLAVKAIPVEAVAAPLEEAAKVLVADSCTGLPGVAEPVYPLLTAEQSKNFVEQFKACFRPIGEITNVDWGTGPSRTVKVVARIHDSVICDMIESEKVVGTSMSLEQLGLDYKELEEKLYRSQGIPPGMLDVNRHNYETDLLRRMYGDVKETRRYSSQQPNPGSLSGQYPARPKTLKEANTLFGRRETIAEFAARVERVTGAELPLPLDGNSIGYWARVGDVSNAPLAVRLMDGYEEGWRDAARELHAEQLAEMWQQEEARNG